MMTLYVSSSIAECIEEDENMYYSSTLGDTAWQVSRTTFISDDVSETCGDGGYVTCISTYGKEDEAGRFQLGSIQFSCSNGFVSKVHGDETVGTTECAPGGITSAYGWKTRSLVTDGGFRGHDSSGRDMTISRWGEGSASAWDYLEYDEIFCPGDGRYVIGFTFNYPDATYFDDQDNLWGFKLICSDEDSCPQNGLSISSYDDESDSSLDYDSYDRDDDSDDFVSQTSGVSQPNFGIVLWVKVVVASFSFFLFL